LRKEKVREHSGGKLFGGIRREGGGHCFELSDAKQMKLKSLRLQRRSGSLWKEGVEGGSSKQGRGFWASKMANQQGETVGGFNLISEKKNPEKKKIKRCEG